MFGKDYIQELSANLPAGQGKVTVKTRDGFGNTALHLAAGRGDRLGCHFLVSNGADVAALNNYGRRFFCTSFSCIIARALSFALAELYVPNLCFKSARGNTGEMLQPTRLCSAKREPPLHGVDLERFANAFDATLRPVG